MITKVENVFIECGGAGKKISGRKINTKINTNLFVLSIFFEYIFFYGVI